MKQFIIVKRKICESEQSKTNNQQAENIYNVEDYENELNEIHTGFKFFFAMLEIFLKNMTKEQYPYYSFLIGAQTIFFKY